MFRIFFAYIIFRVGTRINFVSGKPPTPWLHVCVQDFLGELIEGIESRSEYGIGVIPGEGKSPKTVAGIPERVFSVRLHTEARAHQIKSPSGEGPIS